MMRSAAVRRLDHLTFHEAAGIGDVLRRDLLEVEQRGVEQQPGQHLLVVHGLRDVIDGDRGRPRWSHPPPCRRIRCPRPARARCSNPGSRRGCRRRPRTAGMSSSPGPTGWRNGSSSSSVGAFERCRRVVDLQPEGAHRRAVGDVEGMREAFLLGVDDEVDVALMPARHGLGLVPAGPPEAERRQQSLELRRAGIVDGELHEFGPERFRSGRQRRNRRDRCLVLGGQLIEQERSASDGRRRPRCARSRRGTGR